MQRELVAAAGETSVYIEVEINAAGDLVFSGQDIGAAPERAFGDSDYEYWLTVQAADKLRLAAALGEAGRSDQDLLDRIAARYAGDTRVISKVMEILKATGIPYRFQSF